MSPPPPDPKMSKSKISDKKKGFIFFYLEFYWCHYSLTWKFGCWKFKSLVRIMKLGVIVPYLWPKRTARAPRHANKMNLLTVYLCPFEVHIIEQIQALKDQTSWHRHWRNLDGLVPLEIWWNQHPWSTYVNGYFCGTEIYILFDGQHKHLQYAYTRNSVCYVQNT